MLFFIESKEFTLSAEFIGPTEVLHVTSKRSTFGTMLKAVSGAGIESYSRNPSKPNEITVGDIPVTAESLFFQTDDATNQKAQIRPEANLERIKAELSASKAVALLCRGQGPSENSPWILLTGYREIDGEPSNRMRVIDPKDDGPTHVANSEILRRMQSASRLVAYALTPHD